MTAEVGLTDAEREALAPWDGGIYSCACEDRCSSLPCQNDRDDVSTTVERIVREREAKARAEALRQAAIDLPSLTEGPLRVGTALWPECDRDAYSLAIEEAQAAITVRANQEAAR